MNSIGTNGGEDRSKYYDSDISHVMDLRESLINSNTSDLHRTSSKLKFTNDEYNNSQQSFSESQLMSQRKSSLKVLTSREFYQKDNWLEDMCEVLFKMKRRGTSVKAELYHGVIHFISCLYCLAVVPMQLQAAGYIKEDTIVAVALCSGVGSIFCGLFANLPFVLAPPTVVSIFLSVFLQQNGFGPKEGNYGVMISGALLMLFGWRPLGEFVRYLIPLPIQVGTAVGIGLLTSLAGSTEINFVKAGKYTILELGAITTEVIISFVGVFLICITMRFHIKGSFCIAVISCSLMWWSHDYSFPSSFVDTPHLNTADFNDVNTTMTPLLTADLLFLFIIYLNGILVSLSNLAVLTREDGGIPRGRWIFILSGLFTIVSGLFTSAPILVSPESSAAIKEGAKTGLSTIVAGVLFLLSSFCSPLFKYIPAAGTSPVLIMIGVILFQNVNRIDWRNVADAAPAFIVLFYIPFTYSVIQGVILGYMMYLAITLCTGELLENTLQMILIYFPSSEAYLNSFKGLEPYILKKFSALGRNRGNRRESVDVMTASSAAEGEIPALLPHSKDDNDALMDMLGNNRMESLESGVRSRRLSSTMDMSFYEIVDEEEDELIIHDCNEEITDFSTQFNVASANSNHTGGDPVQRVAIM